MMRLADYVAGYLADRGVRHVFLLTGGGAMHLNDAFGREPRIRCVFNHHEQACAMAAEGYARAGETMAVVNVTTGPGGTNALTGVLGQWLDSVPVLYVSGQVRIEMTVAATGLPLRQLGDQEADIVAIVRPIVKYAVMVTDPKSIRYHLDRAIQLAVSGRPGPVWLDIPLDVQAAMIDEAELEGTGEVRSQNAEVRMQNGGQERTAEDTEGAGDGTGRSHEGTKARNGKGEGRQTAGQQDSQTVGPTTIGLSGSSADRARVRELAAKVLARLVSAQRPVVLAGAGIRIAGAAGRFLRVAERLGAPVLAAWDAIDLVPCDHSLYCGRPGTVGQRAANFIFQNADFLLNIGCRLNTRQIGYNFPSVARAAWKVSVDIDPAELAKPTFRPDLPVCCDAGLFLELLEELAGPGLAPKPDWLAWCRDRRARYPVVTPEQRQPAAGVNPYAFCEALSARLGPDDVIVSSNGAACVVPIQALDIRAGQRHIVNSGCAAMGYGLPAAVGACFAAGRRVICLEGDGSIQLNIQELATARYHNLPLFIFVFNNGGYLSIRTTQRSFFAGRLVGEGPASGVGLPDYAAVARAYGVEGFVIRDQEELATVLPAALRARGPVLVDVRMDPEQTFVPRVTSKRRADGRMVSSPLEDMYPFLDRTEFLSNMIIPPWEPD